MKFIEFLVKKTVTRKQSFFFSKLQACRTNPQIYYERTRDKARTPLQWNSSINAGFSVATKTWLPVADNYPLNNIALQRSQNISHFQNFKKLIELRSSPTMKYGDFEMMTSNSDLIVYKRQLKQSTTNIFVIVLNRAATEKIVDLNGAFNGSLPSEMEVIVASIHSRSLVVG